MKEEPTPKSSAEVRELLEQALVRLAKDDSYLFAHDLHERTITHKLGEYLQPLFPDWNVDCEYNRDEHEPKRVNLDDIPEEEWGEGSNVYPDIIVHHRGDNDHNLLIIEAKKRSALGGAIDNYDRRKIEAFSRGLEYGNGAALTFRIGEDDGDRIELHFYSNGKWSAPARVSSASGPKQGDVA